MQTGMIDSPSRAISAASDSSSLYQFAARRPDPAFAASRTFAKRSWSAVATIAVVLTLSGCGVFCAGAGASGGGFAAGCGTGVRF